MNARPRCRAKTRSGKPCKAPASKDGLCPIHTDPSRASDMGRKSGKARRYVMDRKERLPAPPFPQTAHDVSKALGQVMADLAARRMDARVASALAYVGNVMLRAIEAIALIDPRSMGAMAIYQQLPRDLTVEARGRKRSSLSARFAPKIGSGDLLESTLSTAYAASARTAPSLNAACLPPSSTRLGSRRP